MGICIELVESRKVSRQNWGPKFSEWANQQWKEKRRHSLPLNNEDVGLSNLSTLVWIVIGMLLYFVMHIDHENNCFRTAFMHVMIF